MPSPKQAVSCRYHYDPLDRLTGTDQTGEANAQRFYQKTHLVTEIQGELQRTIFQHDDQLLAQHQKQGTDAAATLLATDQQRSVLHTLDGPDHKQQSYSAYGHRPAESGLNALLGFNGERRDPVTGCYMLGNGYRAFNPVLMRFNSPDSLSPFGEGGLNGYAYCQGDPVNYDDPTGHVRVALKTFIFRGAKVGGLKVVLKRLPTKSPLKIMKAEASTTAGMIIKNADSSTQSIRSGLIRAKKTPMTQMPGKAVNSSYSDKFFSRNDEIYSNLLKEKKRLQRLERIFDVGESEKFAMDLSVVATRMSEVKGPARLTWTNISAAEAKEASMAVRSSVRATNA